MAEQDWRALRLADLTNEIARVEAILTEPDETLKLIRLGDLCRPPGPYLDELRAYKSELEAGSEEG